MRTAILIYPQAARRSHENLVPSLPGWSPEGGYAKLGVHSQVDLIRLLRRGTKRPADDQETEPSLPPIRIPNSAR